MLDCRAVDTLRLRFPNQTPADVPIGPGLHGIGRNADGALVPVEEGARMLAQLCIDRRGTWLKLGAKFAMDSRWEGDTLHFTRSGVDGHIALAPNELHVTAQLGFLLSAMKGPIEQEIRRVLSERFA